jgi:hypothetical protein
MADWLEENFEHLEKMMETCYYVIEEQVYGYVVNKETKWMVGGLIQISIIPNQWLQLRTQTGRDENLRFSITTVLYAPQNPR